MSGLWNENLENLRLSVPRASSWTKNQFFKTPNLTAVRSLSPYIRPFGPGLWAAHSYKNES